MSQKIDLKSTPIREIAKHTLTDKSWLYYIAAISGFWFIVFSVSFPMAIIVPAGLMFFSFASIVWGCIIVASLIALGISSIVVERMYRKLRFYEKAFVIVAKAIEKDPDFATKIENAHDTIPCLEIRYMLKGVLDEKYYVKNERKVDKDYAITINKSILDEILHTMIKTKSELEEFKKEFEEFKKGKSEKEQQIGKNIHAQDINENTKIDDEKTKFKSRD